MGDSYRRRWGDDDSPTTSCAGSTTARCGSPVACWCECRAAKTEDAEVPSPARQSARKPSHEGTAPSRAAFRTQRTLYFQGRHRRDVEGRRATTMSVTTSVCAFSLKAVRRTPDDEEAMSPKRCSVGTSSANPANTALKMWTTSRPRARELVLRTA
jgi:hypothetical protein